ncbi:MAG: NAD-dependent epimerase/dehydratase family protein [Asgard group archaeon]|nr:NAD-dependent epimerase/dehydratase family protein [Asgard group archaeon]
MFDDKKILVTGGTGSLGKILVQRILSNELGRPKKLIIFSRDEAKQHFMRLKYMNLKKATDDVIYQDIDKTLKFIIGDVRDYSSVASAVKDADIIFNAAALKQVPSCEYFPFEAVKTNILGAQNIVRAIEENDFPVEMVVGVSTDKAVNPINVMGMTKAMMERILINANLRSNTKFICVRYGNVLASRGSVIPFFLERIKNGEPVPITSPEMTRFFLNLDKAVDTIFTAIKKAKRGEIYIPQVASAKIIDLAEVLIDGRDIEIKIVGIRPGEKIHEVLISDEEINRTIERNNFYVIKPIIPELIDEKLKLTDLKSGYSSKDDNISKDEIRKMLKDNHLTIEDMMNNDNDEVLR